MQRPDAFLSSQEPVLVEKNQNLCSSDGLEDKGHLNRICNRLQFKKYQEILRKNESAVNLLKEELARVTKSNEELKKIQIKLINQLKQKNLEYYFYKRELKKERRLHYLLRLETDGAVNAPYQVPSNRYTFGNTIVPVIQRWLDAIISFFLLCNII